MTELCSTNMNNLFNIPNIGSHCEDFDGETLSDNIFGNLVI